nr:hypothetical protein [Kineococcus indalonis]
MAQAVADDLDVHPGGQREAGVGVPQVVQPDDRHPGRLDELAEGVRDDVGPQQIAVLPGEDQPVLDPRLPPRGALGLLHHPVAPQDVDGQRVDGHHPRAGRRLRRPQPRAVVPFGDLPRHDDVGALEVDVAPVQPDRLAAAHAGEGDEVEERGEAVLGSGVEERGDVARLPHGTARGPVLRQLDLHRGVEGEKAALDGGVQRRSQGAVHVLDGRRARAAVAAVEQVGVQGVEVVGAQVLQPVVPQRRGQVAPDVHRVAAPGGFAQVALAGQPLLEVLGDGEGAVLPQPGLLAGDLGVQGLLRLALGGETRAGALPALPVGAATGVDDETPRPAAAVRQQLAVGVARAGGDVPLPHGAPLHRRTPTRSSSGAVGTRMSLPSRTTGVGQLSVRISS